jgi:hypothetical protein
LWAARERDSTIQISGILMIHITLPDGSKREFPGPVTVADVAASIGTGLAKAALGGKIGDKLVDTSHTINTDSPCPSSLPRIQTDWS